MHSKRAFRSSHSCTHNQIRYHKERLKAIQKAVANWPNFQSSFDRAFARIGHLLHS